jgi:hypothetical protein
MKAVVAQSIPAIFSSGIIFFGVTAELKGMINRCAHQKRSVHEQ